MERITHAGAPASQPQPEAASDNGGSSHDDHRRYHNRMQQAAAQVQQRLREEEQRLRTHLRQLQTNFEERMRQRQADIHLQIKSEADDMKRRHQQEGEEFRQKMEREKAAFEQSMRSQAFTLGMSGIMERVAAKTKEGMEAYQVLAQRHIQEGLAFQQATGARIAKAVEEFKREQAQVAKDIQSKVEELQKEIQRTVEREKEQLFDPDPRFAHCQLTDDQKRHFISQGFVHVPGVVPPELLQEALKLINFELSKGFRPEELLTFRRPHVEGSWQITDLLYKTAALPLAQSLVGKTHPGFGGQIALRFPGFSCIPAGDAPWLGSATSFVYPEGWHRGWHIDGLHSPLSGVPRGQVHNFTILLGVLLGDVPEPMSGNLTVFPGGHLALQNHFRKEGTQAIHNEGDKGIPRDRLSLAPPHQIRGKAGDIVLAHYCMPHTVAPNVSSNIRYAVYFRLSSVAHTPGTFRKEALTDIWLDYAPLRPLLGRPPQP